MSTGDSRRRRRLPALGAALAGAVLLTIGGGIAGATPAAPVLRVGVVDGA